MIGRVFSFGEISGEEAFFRGILITFGFGVMREAVRVERVGHHGFIKMIFQACRARHAGDVVDHLRRVPIEIQPLRASRLPV